MFNTGRLIGAAFSVLIGADAIFDIVYGAMGTAGNSVFTGAVLSLSIATMFGFSFRQIVLMPADYLFGGFLLVIAASMAANGQTSNPKEWVLLLLVLATYPSFRLIPFSKVEEIRNVFVKCVSAIVAIGTVLTAYSLVTGSEFSEGGHPFVIGHADAATQFFFAMCFVLIAVTTRQLTFSTTLIICTSSFVPLAIFAASMVRAGFIALVGSLVLVTIFSKAKQRRYVFAVVLTVCAAFPVGFLMRPTIAVKPAGEVIEQNRADASNNHPPTCDLEANKSDSIAVRKILLADGLYFAKRSGPLGFGLDSFLKLECIDIFQVHNSMLQVVVEFGWLGGAILASLLAVAGLSLIPVARQDASARFVLSSLALSVAIGMVHGRISRDFILFAFMGWAVSIKEHCQSGSQSQLVTVGDKSS